MVSSTVAGAVASAVVTVSVAVVSQAGVLGAWVWKHSWRGGPFQVTSTPTEVALNRLPALLIWNTTVRLGYRLYGMSLISRLKLPLAKLRFGLYVAGRVTPLASCNVTLISDRPVSPPQVRVGDTRTASQPVTRALAGSHL